MYFFFLFSHYWCAQYITRSECTVLRNQWWQSWIYYFAILRDSYFKIRVNLLLRRAPTLQIDNRTFSFAFVLSVRTKFSIDGNLNRFLYVRAFLRWKIATRGMFQFSNRIKLSNGVSSITWNVTLLLEHTYQLVTRGTNSGIWFL